MPFDEAMERWTSARDMRLRLAPVAEREISHHDFAPSLAPTIYCSPERIAACLAASQLGTGLGGTT
jgi:hypothetical protein